MMLRNTLFFIGFFVFIGLRAYGQDKHFTQFYSAPLTLNPALTGAFDGKYRLSAIYRDQWRAVLDEPYVTFSGAFDLRFNTTRRGAKYKDVAAVGLLFFADKAPGLDFSTNQISISGAFHKSLNNRNTQYLTAGFQGGIAQRNINFEDITFSDQFNGVDGYTDLTAEDFPLNNFSFSDFAAGVNYAYVPRSGFALYIGAAMHHILEPDMSFYRQQVDTDPLFPDSKLFRKYSVQFSMQLPLGERVYLLPRANAAFQGPHAVANAGADLRFLLSPYSGMALHIGSWVRPVRDENSAFRMDALVGLVGLELQNILLGISYDANLTDLSSASSGQGALEISLAYLGMFEDEVVLCPKF